MWCHYEAFTCFGIWQEPSLHTCREAKNSSRMCVSSVGWKESHCMVWRKKKHLCWNRSMCWFTELSPAGSVCACGLLSSLSRWALGHQAMGGVCGHCWEGEEAVAVPGAWAWCSLGTVWKREATKKSLKENFREQRGRTALLWSLGSKSMRKSKSKKIWQISLCIISSWSRCSPWKNTDIKPLIFLCWFFLSSCASYGVELEIFCRYARGMSILHRGLWICLPGQMSFLIAVIIFLAATLY